MCSLHFICNSNGRETLIGDFCSRLSSRNVTKPCLRFSEEHDRFHKRSAASVEFDHPEKSPVWLKNPLNTICCGEQSGKIVMSPIRQRFVPSLIDAALGTRTGCRSLTRSESGSRKINAGAMRWNEAPAADPHLAPGPEAATRCGRERKAKTTESAIRLRFVPALVERLISGGFSPVQDQAGIGHSR